MRIRFLLLAAVAAASGAGAAGAGGGPLADTLRAMGTDVFPMESRAALAGMLRADVRARRDAVNRRDRGQWSRIHSRADWERFAKPRLRALRASLGDLPAVPSRMAVHLGRALPGDGFRIENLVYESRPGVFVTANLYLPSPLREKMPCFLLIHSHHNPRTQGELQDMGMTWARAGAMVLVPDQAGYGERRVHRPGNRQDYRFRYINAQQLHVLGDSLIGWMAWDTMRGIDLLLSRKGADPSRVILIGSVAGGGDPAAVVAALDPRVTCAIPFNFGGPQPETTYPLPEDAAASFNYMGSAYWESTRNLRLSARDGFLPWVIVGAVAPRRLIYAHEFSWDRERDPVWQRLGALWGFYGAGDCLSFTHGGGLLSGQPPDATHCNNVGAVHRRMIHAALERWHGIRTPEEYSARRPPEELQALTPELLARLKPHPAHELYQEAGAARAAKAAADLERRAPRERKRRLREIWGRLLGGVEPATNPDIEAGKRDERDGVRVERVTITVERQIRVPLLLLSPSAAARRPVVVCLSQEGKARFLRERAAEIAQLLERGVAVCLPDLRGTGETAPEGGRGYQSEATSLSAAELMFGDTLLGARLRDLRSVIRYLRTRRGQELGRLALWGESFAPANPAGFVDPLIGEGAPPAHSEPMGGLLALFGALYEDDVEAVLARGTLAGYSSILRDRYCYVPHDAVVPGAIPAGDLSAVAAALGACRVRLQGLVDGRNVRVPRAEADRAFESARKSSRFTVDEHATADAASWLAHALLEGDKE